MKEYLVFRLYGPMASWGQAAVGGDRPTGIQPTRSAIIGLLAAALGVRREEEGSLQALQQSIKIAIKQCVPTSLMRDYHTTQVPSHSNKVIHRTRKSELSESKLNTILSSRDYRCDGLWVVAVSLTANAKKSLLELQQALLKPTFILCLGRKSCPLALPVLPVLTEVATTKEALDYDYPPLTRSKKEDAMWLGANKLVTYFWEGQVTDFGAEGVMTTHPWDEPIHRGRWQFRQREQHQITIGEE